MTETAERDGTPKEGRRTLAALAFFVAVPLILFFPALFLNKLIYGHDVFALGLPFYCEIQKSLAAHQWPLWMPDLLGGMPGIASCNLMFLSPTYLIGYLGGLPFQTLLGLDASVHVALAGIGMFLFLRRLGRGFPAALLGAFFFALSGSELSQLYGGFYNFVEGVALVPWAFWAAHKGAKEGSWFAWGLCGLAFALQVLAGASQLLAYTLAALACFTLALAWKGEDAVPGQSAAPRGPAACLPVLKGLALALGAAFLLSAPQLWLTLQYLPLAARSGFSHAAFVGGSISLSDALTWWVPGFFGWQEPTYHGAVKDSFTTEYFGLLPWALAACALSALWLRDARVRWMAALALLAFFFAQGFWTPFYALFQSLPIVSGFRIWSRTLFLLTFAVCSLAAFGWDALRARETRAAALRGACVFSALALAAAALAFAAADGRAALDAPAMPWLPALAGSYPSAVALLASLARQSALATLGLVPALLVFLFLAARRLDARVALLLALAVHCLDLQPLFTRFIRFTDIQTAMEKTNFAARPPSPPGLEPWRVLDPDSANPNNAILLGYENLYGDESVPIASFARLMSSVPPSTGAWTDFLDLFNVRYVFRHSKLKSSVPGDQVTVYENRGALPRAWLVGRSVRVPGEEEACRLVAGGTFEPRSEVALAVDAGLGGAPPKGSVAWLARSPQSFSLAVTTDEASALVLSDTWYPSWRCSVDGRDAPVLKADGDFQAVILGPGRHRLDFSFDDGLFYDALAACLAGLAALIGLALMGSGNKKGGALRRSGP
ncbi:MAG TPA: hypothetical protein VK914_06760 [bacterium]|jgi:hypothetical protein|nr:hypothetical protein [bacterium]